MAEGVGAAVSEPRRPRQGARPISVYLAILALVALVPAFVFSALLIQRNNEAQERVVETLTTGNARSIVQAVDREIVANINTLRVLATMPELLDGDLAGFHARVSEALAGTGSYVYVVDSDFNSILSTRVPFDEQQKLPMSDVATAKRALTTRDVAVSDAVFGKLAQRWVVNILLPMFPPDRPPLLLGFSRDVSQLSNTMLANKMPDGWSVALVDRQRIVIAGSGSSPEAGKTLGFDFGTDPSEAGWHQVGEGDNRLTVVTQQSQLTGWTLVAWAPYALVTKPLSDTFWSLLGGGILLAALVVFVVYRVSISINRSVRGLEADAKRLGSGQPVEARPFPIAEIETVSTALGEASRRRQAAETEVRFLMRELAHRSKNQMTVIAAMAKQTARGADSVPDFVTSFERRIMGLARSTDLLLAHGVAGVDLRELLTSQIDPICPVEDERTYIEGPSLRINAQAAQIVGMAVHELATNAVKHGAFATENGKLKLTWSRVGDAVAIVWTETGFTPPEDIHRRGFGTTVMENMVGRALGSDVVREMLADGIEWRMTIPLASLDPDNSLNGSAVPETDHAMAAVQK
ncbi:sensor histidine kinase [Devosia sp.]|uniref:sensor histidine kinase n=1 Tax=Devosia sp. TaxID=1871048 RepID=UPI003BA859F1